MAVSGTARGGLIIACVAVGSVAAFAALAAPVSGRGLDTPDLASAFAASFGRPGPFLRNWNQPMIEVETGKIFGTSAVVLAVHAHDLVPLAGRRYALISYEDDTGGGHANPGEIAISYLHRTASGWRLERLWPEFIASGVGGRPANAGVEIHRFGGDPLVMARTEWCGMGECSDWFDVIRLSADRPVAYDAVLAGAASPVDAADLDPDDDNCENYDVQARVGPPRRPGTLFSISYDGWTAAPKTLSPKRPLHLVTSYAPRGSELAMQPVVPVPECGR